VAKFDLREIRDGVDLPDGRRAIIVDWMKKDIDPNRNAFLYKEGKLVWQIQTDHDTDVYGPFTKIEYTNGKLRAFRFIGAMYDIDIDTGFATPAEFVK
jgi:hypothetical protein